MRVDHYMSDTRMKDEDDVLRVAVKFRQVKELMLLREQLENALDDPRDEWVYLQTPRVQSTLRYD